MGARLCLTIGLFCAVSITAAAQNAPELGPPCGNGRIEGKEDCEPGLPVKISCSEYKDSYVSGELKCVDCKFDDVACVGTMPSYCGNAVVEPGEECEAGSMSEETSCLGIGGTRGTPGPT